MRHALGIRFLFLIASIVFSSSVFANLSANYPPASTYQVVTLRKNCLGADGCFEDLAAAVNWAFANASATNRITLQIGPGTFSNSNPGAYFCNNAGYVSFVGSGRDNTILPGMNYEDTEGNSYVLSINSCTSLVFQDLTIKGASGILWTGSGSSTWSNVLVDVNATGWWDQGTTGSVHYWFGSVIRVNHAQSTGPNYYLQPIASGSPTQTWFYGGDIEANGYFVSNVNRMFGVQATTAGSLIELFGTSVRINQFNNYALGSTFNLSEGSIGLVATNGGAVHAHGANIKVTSASANTPDMGCWGAAVASGGMIHTPGSSFVINCGNGGTSNRILTDGNASNMITSPFWWGSGTTPPNAISSITGQDMFVQTNCAATGCTTAGNQSHLLIYNSQCTNSSPWFDVGLNKCVGAP